MAWAVGLRVALLALVLTQCAARTARVDPTLAASSSSQGRVLPRAAMVRKAPTNKCTNVVCPDTSTCQSVGGAPTCQCDPDLFSRLINRTCTIAPLLHWGYLDPHNEARAAVGSPDLIWDTSLALKAQSWANSLVATNDCNLKLGGRPVGVGQNVANFFSDPSFRATNATNIWVAQGGKYTRSRFTTLGAGGCSTGNWKNCAAYTQVVWRNTKKLGCAVSQCPARNGKVWVCNYFPSGNIGGQFPF